jgi:endoglucanase Acf2
MMMCARHLTARALLLPTFVAGLLAIICTAACAGEPASVEKLGLGSYALQPPPGAKEPPATVYKTDKVRGPLPTNQWWSSLLWAKYSNVQYPHPLAVRATAAGLQVFYPGPSIAITEKGIIGGGPGKDRDLILGHTAVDEFPDARLDGYSDWFVTAAFISGDKSLHVTYGHGSPFVYAMYGGGEPRIALAEVPTVWSGGADSPVLGLSLGNRHYGLFAPTGSTWTGLGGKVLACHTGGKPYFSVALLPDKSPETLQLFRKYAYSHVTDTRVEWKYDEKPSLVSTRYTFTTRPYEGIETGTLFALYPHQWLSGAQALTGKSYASVRGEMRLACGSTMETRAVFPGVLPALPDAGGCDKARLAKYVEQDAEAASPKIKDTYWEGKHLGKVQSLAAIAEQAGDPAAAGKFAGELRGRLETWFTADDDAAGQVKKSGLFYYNRPWGTLIGYPASYGSDEQLNDHHFHYGYFLRAAAEVARREPAWAADARWGGMVKLITRDIAGTDRADPLFPRLRCFDPYAGHSWASGHAKFDDGNNQESSSEAMNAWTGLILYGQATGDLAMRDLGIYLYTTEMAAINAYWFDVTGTIRPAAYKPSQVTMVWGGKGVNETWFSNKPEIVHGINWLPFHGGSLYLGLEPAYVRKNYASLTAEKGGEKWADWADLVLMYRALDDARDALRQFDALGDSLKIEAGNSRAFTYHWIANLAALGHVEAGVTADYPLRAVFNDGRQRTYVVFNSDAKPLAVKFSDGTGVTAGRKGFTILRRPVTTR